MRIWDPSTNQAVEAQMQSRAELRRKEAVVWDFEGEDGILQGWKSESVGNRRLAGRVQPWDVKRTTQRGLVSFFRGCHTYFMCSCGVCDDSSLPGAAPVSALLQAVKEKVKVIPGSFVS